MADELNGTIELLSERIRAKESEANQLKKLVNDLCAEARLPIRFPNLTEVAAGAVVNRADQFYGLPLNTAMRNYLEMRKAANLGPATITEIFKALKEGGYKFDTKNDDIARIVVGNSLRKTAVVFHKLPTGQYGLLSWYPAAKVEDDAKPRAKKSGAKWRSKKSSNSKAAQEASAPENERAEDENAASEPTEGVTAKEVREVILSQSGQFTSGDISNAIKSIFPTKVLPKAKVPNIIFMLKKAGKLKEIAARTAEKGAIYVKT